MSEMNPGAGFDESARDRELASLRGLLELSTVLTAARDEMEIARQTTAAVPSFCDCCTSAIHLDGAWLPEAPAVPDLARLEAQLPALGLAGGRVRLPRVTWTWAYPLASLAGALGFLVVAADAEPERPQQFLLGLLAQHAGNALINARLHRQERAAVARERALVEGLSASNLALERSMHEAENAREALQRRLDVHDLLTRIGVASGGPEGIAEAVHQLTGLPVAIEDRFGTLMAWAGSDRPEPYPKARPGEREELIRAALSSHGRPLQHGDRVVAVAQFRREVLGVIALIDPGSTWADVNRGALEHGATVLAMELAHLRNVAETELRLRGELVEELLEGVNLEGILDRCRAIGYDLDRPHRVIVVEGGARNTDNGELFHAVRRAARDLGVGSLLAGDGGRACLLAEADVDWSVFRGVVLADLGSGGRCRVGVGGPCSAPADFAQSRRQAQLALNVQASVGAPTQVVVFDDLGVYRLLSEGADVGSMESFVRRWLGALLDYDASKGADLVSTLSAYLDCGGKYDSAASRLAIHRSTLRYRLGRIRDISGRDLADSDTRFNLQLATRALSTIYALRET
ncbi:MAG: PucR family transcriptional regulator [Candidatus Limnocylindria bacterium]